MVYEGSGGKDGSIKVRERCAEATHTSLQPAGHPDLAGSVAGLGTADVEQRQLTEAEVEEIVRREVASRRAAAAEYDHRGEPEHAERLRAEADALGAHLGGWCQTSVRLATPRIPAGCVVGLDVTTPGSAFVLRLAIGRG